MQLLPRRREMLGHLPQFHSEAQVRLIDSVPPDGFAVLHVPEWSFHLDSRRGARSDRKSTRLNSSHSQISYAVFCLKKKKIRCLHATGLQLGQTDAAPPQGGPQLRLVTGAWSKALGPESLERRPMKNAALEHDPAVS